MPGGGGGGGQQKEKNQQTNKHRLFQLHRRVRTGEGGVDRSGPGIDRRDSLRLRSGREALVQRGQQELRRLPRPAAGVGQRQPGRGHLQEVRR